MTMTRRVFIAAAPAFIAAARLDFGVPKLIAPPSKALVWLTPHSNGYPIGSMAVEAHAKILAGAWVPVFSMNTAATGRTAVYRRVA